MDIGQIITYDELRAFAGFQIQHGMNFQLKNGRNIFLMSSHDRSPYSDVISDKGETIHYQGHNEKKSNTCNDPSRVDQPRYNKNGSLTPNGKFEKAALSYKNGIHDPINIQVFNKIKDGLWSFCGTFSLIDVDYKTFNGRKIFKFKLLLTAYSTDNVNESLLRHDRIIPAEVQAEVYKRDQGRCVKCGESKNLHFDHIIPFSKGGSSKVSENIQLLCAHHNLTKGNRFK